MDTETTEVNTHKNNATQFVGSHSMTEIIEHLTTYYEALEESKNANRVVRGKLQDTVNSIAEFIKNCYSEGATTDDIKELADELDIEMTKNITVTLTAKVEVELTVPLDFDNDEITESMFNVTVESSYRNDDIQWDNDSIDIEDFDVEEN